ncbi:MAG TPA: FAD-dependent oxidoreductase [Pseudolysinimonas sp.]|nr:FAD-dependent oxidoreductase [Pseudolysinimonas sp.]
MIHTDYAVIGAGLTGAAAAWRLAADGNDVTVLERTIPANDLGSSHGSARIFRYAYAEELYTELVQQSKVGWDELEALSGRQLITPTGAVDFGGIRDPEGLSRVLTESGVENELLTESDAEARFEGFDFDTSVLWHPGAGVIDAHNSVAAMLDLATADGATVLTGWDVSRITAADSGYLLTSATGDEVHAENLIVCAGGWLPDLLRELPIPDEFLAAFPALEVTQEQAYHFPYRDVSQAGSWPTFIYKSDEIQVYGLPGGRDADGRGQKVAEYAAGRHIGSAAHHDKVLDPANRERVIAFVREFLPGLDPTPYAETTCLFTMTPNEDFVIDRVDGITVLSPCSGHGAKFAPLLGRFAADLATGAAGAEDIPAIFRPSRELMGRDLMGRDLMGRDLMGGASDGVPGVPAPTPTPAGADVTKPDQASSTGDPE